MDSMIWNSSRPELDMCALRDAREYDDGPSEKDYGMAIGDESSSKMTMHVTVVPATVEKLVKFPTISPTAVCFVLSNLLGDLCRKAQVQLQAVEPGTQNGSMSAVQVDNSTRFKIPSLSAGGLAQK